MRKLFLLTSLLLVTVISAVTSYAMTPAEYNEQGDIRYEKDDYNGALQNYTNAIKADPAYAQAYFNRGMTKEKLGDYDGAIADYTKAIAMNSTYKTIAQEYINSLKDYKATMERYKRSIKLNPDNAKTYADRAFYRFQYREDYQGALEDYSKAITLNPNDAISYHERGYIKSLYDDNQGAIADYNKAISLYPDTAIWYYDRGESKYAIQDYKGAIADWQKAIDMVKNGKSSFIKGGITKDIIEAQVDDAKQKLTD